MNSLLHARSRMFAWGGGGPRVGRYGPAVAAPCAPGPTAPRRHHRMPCPHPSHPSSALAPEMISMSSVVILACRPRL